VEAAQQIAESIGVSKSSTHAAVGWVINEETAGANQENHDRSTAVQSADPRRDYERHERT